MTSVTFAVNPELKSEIDKFLWINWSGLVRKRLQEREMQAELLLRKLESKEEQEFIKWSVDLGRRAKKESFKKLLSEVSPEIRERLLKRHSKKGKSLG